MNDEARELLVAAALNGHTQIHGAWHSESLGWLYQGDVGDCAQGRLHLAMHATRPEALTCQAVFATANACVLAMMRRFAITDLEWSEIAHRNDAGCDFLTVARKVGTGA